MTTLTITIPDELAEQAKALGLLDDRAFTSLLSEAIRQKHVAELFAAADRLAAVDLPAMSDEEVVGEVKEARAERRARRT